MRSIRMRLPSRSAQIKPTSRSGWVAFLTFASVLGAILRLDESLLPKEANCHTCKRHALHGMMSTVCALEPRCFPTSLKQDRYWQDQYFLRNTASVMSGQNSFNTL